MRTIALFVAAAIGMLAFEPVRSHAVEKLWESRPQDVLVVSSVATDTDGNIFICGSVHLAGSLPQARRIVPLDLADSQSDAVLIKLSPTGELRGAVRWGGESGEEARAVAVDGFGGVVVVGYTWSTRFPVLGGVQSNLVGSSDLFITRFDNSGTNLTFSTYLGGAGTDYPAAMKLTRDGEILIAAQAGSTYPPSFLVPDTLIGSRPGLYVACLSGDGSRLNFSWPFGSEFDYLSSESLTGMDVDAAGNIFLTGRLPYLDVPLVNALQSEVPLPSGVSPAANFEKPYVAKLNREGEILFSTLLGGNRADYYYDKTAGIAVNGAGNVVVAGNTFSSVFPALAGVPPDVSTEVTNRAFVVTLAGDGSAVLGTKLFPASSSVWMHSLDVTPAGDVVAGGEVGYYSGSPAFARVPSDGGMPTISYDLSCGPRSAFKAMAIGGDNGLVVVQNRPGDEFPARIATVVRYAESEWQAPAVPFVHLSGWQIGFAEPLSRSTYLRAEVLGTTGIVKSVKFYDGRRLLGTATNAPFTVEWKRKTRGVHRLKAVAVVDGRPISSCVTTVKVAAPRNDNFAARTPLSGSRVSVTGDTVGASSERPMEYRSQETVWYTWRAPANGIYEVGVEGLSGSPYSRFELRAYRGTALSRLELVAYGGFDNSPNLKVRALRGDRFQFRVATEYAEDRKFKLTLRAVVPIPNDDFTNAVDITGMEAIDIPGFWNATVEPSDPPNLGTIYPPATSASTIWYSWTAASSGLHLVSVRSAGSAPIVRSYTGVALAGLEAAGQEIYGDTNGSALHAVAGTRYWLQLTARDTNAVTLTILPRNAPLNDAFADRIAIPLGVNSVTGSMIGATMEIGEAGYSGANRGGSVWWTWRAPAPGAYELFTQTLIESTNRSGVTPGGVSPVSPGGGPEVYRGSALAILESAVTSSWYARTVGFHATEAGEELHIRVSDVDARFALHIQPVAAPANDAFASATLLAGPRVHQRGTTRGATLELGERVGTSMLPPPGITYNQSVWYRWTAPSNGIFLFYASGLLEVYRGDSLESLTLVEAGLNQARATLVAGVEYRIAVVSSYSFFTLDIFPGTRPANDDFADAEVVTGLNPRISGEFLAAGVEPNEPWHYGSPSVWYAWTAPTNGMFGIRGAADSGFSVYIYTGESLTDLVTVPGGSLYSGPEFYAQEGTTYRISVISRWYDWYPVPFDFELAFLPPVRNDQFANRARLTGHTISITASNTGATLEADEPLNSDFAGGQTVWWTWTAPKDGRVTLAVSNMSAVVNLYTGTNLNGLTAVADTNRADSSVNLFVRAGVTYQICVDRHLYAGTATFQFRIHYTPTPDNDAFSSARPLVGTVGGTFEGGSFEPGEATYGYSSWTSSTWWRWTAPSNGVARFFFGSSPYVYYSGEVGLFTGTAVTNLQLVERRRAGSVSGYYFPVISNQTYSVRVLGDNTSRTGYELSVAYGAPPVNDNFHQRIAVTGTNIVALGSNYTATAELGEPDHGALSARQSVWWTWTAPVTGETLVKLSDYSENQIAIYTGDTITNLIRVAAGAGSARVAAVSNTTYQIAIDGNTYSYWPDGPIKWTLVLPAPPADLPPPRGPGRLIPRLPPIPATPVQQIVETSTNLIDWVRYTNAPANPADFRVTPSTNDAFRFFRIR